MALKQGWFDSVPPLGKAFLLGILALVVLGGVIGVLTS
jgi:hypothetical protein